MNEYDIKKHKRVNDIFFGPLERPALKWLASHQPAWVNPDVLTVIGLLGALISLVGYVLSNFDRNFLWLASFGFVVNWYGDSLDGTLARHRHIERPVYGFFVDHVSDALGQLMIFVGLGLTPYVRFDVGLLCLGGYLLLSAVAYARMCVTGEFKISYGKLGPTEVRFLAILLNTGMYFGGLRTFSVDFPIYGVLNFSPYDLTVGVVILLLLFFFLTTGIKEAARLRKIGK